MAKYLLLVASLLASTYAAPVRQASHLATSHAIAPMSYAEELVKSRQAVRGARILKRDIPFTVLPRKEDSSKEVSHPQTQKEAAGKPLYPQTVNDAFMREAMKAPHVNGKPAVKGESSPKDESDQNEQHEDIVDEDAEEMDGAD